MTIRLICAVVALAAVRLATAQPVVPACTLNCALTDAACQRLITATLTPAVVASLAISPNSVNGGESAQAAVHVTQLPSGQSVQVSLSSNLSSVTVPPAVSVTGGDGSIGSQTFTISTGVVPLDRNVVIEARVGESSATQVLIVRGMGEPSLEAIELYKNEVLAGELFHAVLVLDRPPPVVSGASSVRR